MLCVVGAAYYMHQALERGRTENGNVLVRCMYSVAPTKRLSARTLIAQFLITVLLYAHFSTSFPKIFLLFYF